MTYYANEIKVVFWLGDGMRDACILAVCADCGLDVLQGIETEFRNWDEELGITFPDGTPDGAVVCEYVASYNDEVRDQYGNLELRGYWEFKPTGRYETHQTIAAEEVRG